MAILVSPGVQVNEVDLTTSTPAVSTSTGALAGVFNWGPANTPIQISNEVALNRVFGTPDANTSNSFFTAANFLSYSNNLQVVRAQLSGANNALSNTASANVSIPNEASYFSSNSTYGYNQTGNSLNAWMARYPGNLGNSLQVIVWSGATAFAANSNATFNVSVGAYDSAGTYLYSGLPCASYVPANTRFILLPCKLVYTGSSNAPAPCATDKAGPAILAAAAISPAGFPG